MHCSPLWLKRSRLTAATPSACPLPCRRSSLAHPPQQSEAAAAAQHGGRHPAAAASFSQRFGATPLTVGCGKDGGSVSPWSPVDDASRAGCGSDDGSFSLPSGPLRSVGLRDASLDAELAAAVGRACAGRVEDEKDNGGSGGGGGGAPSVDALNNMLRWVGSVWEWVGGGGGGGGG